MGITIKNQDVLIRLSKERLDKIEHEFEQVLADEATRMVLRTRQGKDVDGNSFAPYTPQYAKFRAKRGRRSTPVDLTFAGNMLAAITTKFERTRDKIVGRIFFNSAREATKARGNQEKRPFFGLSDEQVKRVIEKLKGVK